jgi:hypothetical protein
VNATQKSEISPIEGEEKSEISPIKREESREVPLPLGEVR